MSSRLPPWLLGLVAVLFVLILAWVAGFFLDDSPEENRTAEEMGLIIARGQGIEISREVYLREMRKRALLSLGGEEEIERGREVLDDLIRRRLLAEEARSRGLDGSIEVVEAIERILVNALISDLYQGRSARDLEKEKVEARYARDRETYSRPEMIRLAHLFIEVKNGDRTAARTRAEGAIERARAHRVRSLHFGGLSEEFSDDLDTKSRGGDLGFMDRSRDDLPPSVIEAGFELKAIGEISGVVESDRGFHVLKLTGRRPAWHRSFEEVEMEIRGELLREERSDLHRTLVSELKARADIQVENSLLSLDDVRRREKPVTLPLPPSPPGVTAAAHPLPDSDLRRDPSSVPGTQPAKIPE